MTHAPYDPRYESARATCQSERGWHFPPEPARTESATIWGLKRIAGLAVIVALIWAGLHIA